MAGVLPSSSTLSLLASLNLPYQKPSYSSCFILSTRKSPLVQCKAKKKVSFTDQILDYIEGGPKLRKWYGAPELLPKDGTNVEEDDEFPEGEETRDAVLVTDGDSEMGQKRIDVVDEIQTVTTQRSLEVTSLLANISEEKMPVPQNNSSSVQERSISELLRTLITFLNMMVILSLIVKRARIKALVKDKRAALEAFGTYVESMAGDSRDKPFLRRALRGVCTVICPNEGFLSTVGSLKGVKHVILLSQLSVYKGANGIQALLKSNARKLAEQDESILVASGIPYTVIRAGLLQNSSGGTQGFSFEQGSSAKGTLSKEDAAFICVEAVDAVPQKGFIFEVVNGGEKVSDWKECFNRLMEKSEQQLQ